MPRTSLPTPASSTDLPGQDGSKQLANLQMSFELPPPAINEAETPRPSANDSDVSPSTSYRSSAKAPYPLQAAETVKSRRRSSTTTQSAAAKDSFALPPPPTRSRKIIQMKPRAAQPPDDQDQPDHSGAKSAAGSKNSTNSAAAAAGNGANKKKQPSATSAAGRKIARKTAHSLIERRRRSKMNEEFAVLKGMIPACTGEMHKLAILQASIEYVRYLEDCITQLKSQHQQQAATPTEMGMPAPSPFIPEQHQQFQPDHSPDVEMTGSVLPSPSSTRQTSRSHQPSVSPALLAQDSRQRQDSYSSASSDHRHYSFSISATTSPAFGPQPNYYGPQGPPSAAGSTLTSPALLPQRDLDQEATAALLMLNHDRRGTGVANRGMSVRDLLST